MTVGEKNDYKITTRYFVHNKCPPDKYKLLLFMSHGSKLDLALSLSPTHLTQAQILGRRTHLQDLRAEEREVE